MVLVSIKIVLISCIFLIPLIYPLSVPKKNTSFRTTSAIFHRVEYYSLGGTIFFVPIPMTLPSPFVTCVASFCACGRLIIYLCALLLLLPLFLCHWNNDPWKRKSSDDFLSGWQIEVAAGAQKKWVEWKCWAGWHFGITSALLKVSVLPLGMLFVK